MAASSSEEQQQQQQQQQQTMESDDGAAAAAAAAGGYQSISDFYADKSIFITGITGFLGKVLIEKLLWSCPGIKKIYAMMRPKKGQSVDDRLESLLACKLFDRLKRERPGFRSQLEVVQGDMFEPALGLSADAVQLLCDSVHVVFHSAATVRFDEHLKVAVQMNLEGPKKVALLCEKMRRLEVLVHVSTAYANCDHKVVEEMVYAPEVHPQKLLDAIEWMDDDVLEQVTPRLIGQKPNTYTFTKQLAEFYLMDQFPHLPIVMVRPSIVGASWREPFAGWVDNFNGPTGVFAAMGKGLLRTMQGDVRCRADIVPVDLATNVLIASAWHHCVCRPACQPIYNAGNGPGNRLTWGDVETVTPKYFAEYPPQNAIRPVKASFTTSALWYHISWLFDHQVPAILMDLWMYTSGRKAVFMRVSKRIKRSIKTLEFFTCREWQFNNNNVMSALEKMSPADRQEFECDASTVDWHQYLENYCTGVKQYALKEDMANITSARAHVKKLKRLGLLFNILLCVVAWRLLVKRVPLAHNMWVLMLNLAMSLFHKLPSLTRS